MRKILFLSLLLAACAPPLNERLIPRFAIDASGATVPLGTYFDKVLGHTCSPRNTPTGVRCVTEVNYGPVWYTTPTCTGPALTDPHYFVDEYLRAANRDDGALYEACRAALSLSGPASEPSSSGTNTIRGAAPGPRLSRCFDPKKRGVPSPASENSFETSRNTSASVETLGVWSPIRAAP